MRCFLLLGAIECAMGSMGCQHSVFSPPTRALPLESAATLPPGDIGVQLEGSGGAAVWGVNASSGTGRIRVGVSDHTDVSADATVIHIVGDSVAGTYPNIFAGRAGVKQQLLPSLSLVGGVGGGGSAGGGFIAPDAGAIAAWENPHVVPFFSLRGAVSIPVARKWVDVGKRGADKVGDYVFMPHRTWIAGGNLGLRIPVGKNAPGTVRGSLLGGISLTWLADDRDDETVMGLGGGAEVVF